MIQNEDLDDIQQNLVEVVEQYAENYFQAQSLEDMNYWSGNLSGITTVLELLDSTNPVFITLVGFIESVLNNPRKVIPNKNIQ